jgi:hypothetical protein
MSDQTEAEKIAEFYAPSSSTQPVEPAEEDELIEELAATSTINETFDKFISDVEVWFADVKYTSEMLANPVRTHLDIVALEESILTEAYALRDKLIQRVAETGEEIPVQGGLLRKQVVDSQEG